MADESAILSVDFLVGFTIFLLAFIWIATLVPSLFLGLSSQSVDFDAVAYRTGVILAEDPGATSPNITIPWEFYGDPRFVERFGLAVSKNTPNVLDINKVNRFFCSTAWVYPNDYRQRAIFGDFPYQFNISLKVTGEDHNWTIGDVLPDNFGYIRRDIKVKDWSNTTIGNALIVSRGYNNTENVTSNVFSIEINSSLLSKGNISNPVIDPIREDGYRINPNWDRIIINITGLSQSPHPRLSPLLPASPSDVNITSVFFYRHPTGISGLVNVTPDPKYTFYTYIDGSSIPATLPADLRDNLSLMFDPGFFSGIPPDNSIYINVTFGMKSPMQFLNSSLSGPFEYDYNPTNVTQPSLKDGVMEVAVW